MKKCKEPVYTGPRKGYCAVFLGEGYYPRIRFIYSNNTAEYTFENTGNIKRILNGEPTGNSYPCWHDPARDWQDNYTRLKDYDNRCNNETIFLGYVKDTE